ncbi:hypothetical protein TRFO_18330 [Tritrichomonas foetus]|uniref:Tubby C-terminal domain-containing protein n=1 Tax=Tritrichomonas foetus TaxID=1144522 RepID=A0A1J4KKZ2_9EUKA|nr:hypothetical protein TRFO_18330 [Tritrichomonas foetus]|eukprot:OHT11959.1 hypothetical protein TRFO_18330 [Tritrichomonas foetus]
MSLPNLSAKELNRKRQVMAPLNIGTSFVGIFTRKVKTKSGLPRFYLYTLDQKDLVCASEFHIFGDSYHRISLSSTCFVPSDHRCLGQLVNKEFSPVFLGKLNHFADPNRQVDSIRIRVAREYEKPNLIDKSKKKKTLEVPTKASTKMTESDNCYSNSNNNNVINIKKDNRDINNKKQNDDVDDNTTKASRDIEVTILPHVETNEEDDFSIRKRPFKFFHRLFPSVSYVESKKNVLFMVKKNHCFSLVKQFEDEYYFTVSYPLSIFQGFCIAASLFHKVKNE